jgi:hypothetical protein
MDDAEIAAQAYFMLGASQFLDHRVRRDGHPYPRDEAVVDAYLALLRGGLDRPSRQGSRLGRAEAATGSKTRKVGRVRPPSQSRSVRR